LGKIRLNGKKVKAGERLETGHVISIFEDLTPCISQNLEKSPLPHKKTLPPLTPEEINWLESLIVWEDKDMLVLNKPSGLAVQGGTKTTKHIDRYVSQYGLHKNCQYRLVHRIDRDTSGILLLAKSSTMAAYLTNRFKESLVEKTYWAIVVGNPTPGYGTIKAPLLKAEFGDREKVVVDPKNGKKAVTHYRSIKRLMGKNLDNLTWLELKPETGRTHQIRVHCEHMDTPIVGDGKYGGMMATTIDKKLHLHARSLTIRDREGSRFVFTAPPPDHMIETLKRYKISWNQCL
jgi:23S rRNA pseudouridine955/2504/2580 synthase